MSELSSSTKNKGRLTSDNYQIILHIFINDKRESVDLTEKFGITSFDWESRDEIKVWKPITRIEPISEIIQNGFDLSFGSKKENMDDFMDLLLAQHSMYYGNFFKQDFRYEEAGFSEQAPIGINLRTDINKPQEVKDGSTIFDKFNMSTYVAPIYSLEVRIKHFNLNKDGENIHEAILFKDVRFYKPFQKVSENSASIEEGFKGFASTVIGLTGLKLESTMSRKVEKKINYEFTKESQVTYFTRRVINGDNKNLIK